MQQKNTSLADDYKTVEQFVDMISDFGFEPPIEIKDAGTKITKIEDFCKQCKQKQHNDLKEIQSRR